MDLADLDRHSIDWSDFDTAAVAAEALLAELASERSLLRQLFDRCVDDSALWQMCEHHRLQDKVVLYDALDRGIRIRMHFHVPTLEHQERLHDHRFSFATRILAGAYRHVAYQHMAPLDEVDPTEAAHAGVARIAVVPAYTTVQHAGTHYAMHHSMLHTTINGPDTVSLFVRGPSEKTRRTIIDRATGELWWGYGAGDQRHDSGASPAMSRAAVCALRERAIALRVA